MEAVVAVATHRNLEGLQRLVPALLKQTVSLGVELMVVDNASTDGTREWLFREDGPLTILRLPENEGPGAAFNAVFASRPEAEAYVLFADDTIPRGDEVERLLRSLHSDDHLGIVAGEPVTESGEHLASSYTRRPFAEVFPLLWNRWWGRTPGPADRVPEYVDLVGGSGMTVRGELVRAIGSFETILWPAAFEDLDYCARARFQGWEIAVDREVPIYQEVSVTMNRVFGSQYQALRRASGLLYAALNYPLVIVIGRFLEAAINALTSPNAGIRRGDAHGLLRCARAWRLLVRGRRFRRRLRQKRALGPAS